MLEMKSTWICGVEYSNNDFLYNVIVVMRYPQQGCDFGTRRELVTACPVDHAEALRRSLSLKKAQRECPSGFSQMQRVFLQKVNIPLYATPQDRHNAWWTTGTLHRWAARVQDEWLMKHYRLTVVDSEARTEEDDLIYSLRKDQKQLSTLLADAVQVQDTPTVRQKVAALFGPMQAMAF